MPSFSTFSLMPCCTRKYLAQIKTKTTSKTLKTELDNVKSKMVELQNDYFELQEEYKKLSNNDKSKNPSSWGLNWRKIKNSFHVKQAGCETRDVQDIPTSPSRTRRRSAPRRRLSMS
jgi:hypothetical protein